MLSTDVWVLVAALGMIIQAANILASQRDWRHWRRYDGEVLLPLLRLHIITALGRGSVVTLNLALGLSVLLLPHARWLVTATIATLLYGETVLVGLSVFDRWVRRSIAARLRYPGAS